jgi:pimeloyl-ACP methyl ester carboxylesterase
MPQSVERFRVPRDDVAVLEVLSQGTGPLVVLLPSLGRGAEDFDPIAAEVARAGFRVLRPEPRGIGGSLGRPYENLEDCVGDVAAVIEHEGGGPAFVAGHAFGNRVSRLLATDRPDLVAAVALIAANVGHAPSPPEVRAAIRNSANPGLPREQRLAALRFAFFAPGNDPTPWLEGWHPDVLAQQRTAGDRTSRQRDYAGGGKPILYLQPSHDPLAHVEDAEIFQRENGERVKVVIVPNASHAAIAEQPAFIARELIAYASDLGTGPGATKHHGS